MLPPYSPHRVGARGKGDTLFHEREYPPFDPPRERFVLQASSSKSCAACGIGCLLFFVSKRLGLLLSSLSLCLRFVSLTQFPPTLDLYRLAIVCRGGFAALAAILCHRQQVITLHLRSDSRAAADDRSRGKSYSSSKRGNAARRQSPSGGTKAIRAGDCQSKSFSWGSKGAILFCEREWPL